MGWTDFTRRQYARRGMRYASDLTDREWGLISPCLPAPRRLGRPSSTDLREVVNALLYLATTGCQWRMLCSWGHEVKLIAPQLAKPYVKRGKNDAADAEALCEAMSRPTMRFVPVKTAEQQAALMLIGVRQRLLHNRTQLANAIRGFAMEFGIITAKGMCRIEPMLEQIAVDQNIPELAPDLFAIQAEEYRELLVRIKAVDDQLTRLHRADECSKRLAEIPGVGPIGASLLMMKTPDPRMFKSGRDFPAWIGLTPKDHSTAGKVRLGTITRAGDEMLRSVLVVGATALLQHIKAGRSKHASAWLIGMLQRKRPKLVAVALANKIARIAWKIMVSGEPYRHPGGNVHEI